MKMEHLTKDEVREIRHFVDTGQRSGGEMVTDQWVEDSLEKAIKEVEALGERCDISESTCREWSDIVDIARKLHLANQKGDSTVELFEALKVAFAHKKPAK